ncbi:MAG TPA: RecX family transcriptional regulator [Candidatus Saccharimonadales bacterium]|nr:RecX family transcriptional regulator [Candidatus Saccharimonadales bacterium]
MKPKNDPLKYALYLLGRRGRTKYELKSKLFEKGYETEAIEATLKRLEELTLLDDKTYAELYARDKVAIYRRGRYRIGLELRRKGVDKELVEAAVETIDEADELAAAISLLKGRQRAWKDLHERKRFERSTHLLQRRGFSGKIIRQAIEVWESGQDF